MRFNILKLFAPKEKKPNPNQGYECIKQYVEANNAQLPQQAKKKMEQFYGAYYSYMYNIAVKKWHLSELDAEDMFYQVFYQLVNPRVVQQLHDTPQNFNRYIGGIIRNKAFDLYAKQKKTPPPVALDDQILFLRADLDSNHIQIEKIYHLQNYLNSLSPECQELIMMKYRNKDGEDKMFLKQKAEAWGISDEAIRQRKKRCTDKLRENYKGMMDDE